jgi:primary-amine oxidase
MALDRLKSVAHHVSGSSPPAHPFDPLSNAEIETAVKIISKAHGKLHFNAVTLREPRKQQMLKWLEDPANTPTPSRVADVVAIAPGGKVYDGLVDLKEGKIVKWESLEGVQPLVSVRNLKSRTFTDWTRSLWKIFKLWNTLFEKTPKLLSNAYSAESLKKICTKSTAIVCQHNPPTSSLLLMFIAWTIGYDHRFGNNVRLQQALMYYRPHVDDSQYSFPLDFCPIFDADKQEIIHIDIPEVRRPLNQAKPNNYHPAAIEADGGYRKDIKPINITQPEGVSFKVEGRTIDWQNWKVHVGFNYKEGIVLNNITYNDKGTVRPVFYRLSLAEMVVPYGNPEHPHQRKHAFDLGEYGGGYMTNSLSLGCDCKGAIHYMEVSPHFPLALPIRNS